MTNPPRVPLAISRLNYNLSGETINMIEYVDGDGMCHKQAGLHSSKCFAHILTIDKATESVIQEPKHTDRAENPAEKTEGQAATIFICRRPRIRDIER